MTDDFDEAFRARFRGSFELVQACLRQYLPYVEPLRLLSAPALDLGCGRGEWLTLMRELGLQARGVDAGAAMAASCCERGLDAICGDVLEVLSRQPDASLSLVTAFHLVEHLDFAVLVRLVGEAQRVLVPGGLLIMETPNPENLVVATRTFYHDPGHLRPVPAELLAFVCAQCGFDRVRMLRLQEAAGLRQKASLTLTDVLEGASPDYGLVVQKKAAAEELARFDALFEHGMGVSPRELQMRYDAEQAQRLDDVRHAVLDLQSRSDDAGQLLTQSLAQLRELERVCGEIARTAEQSRRDIAAFRQMPLVRGLARVARLLGLTRPWRQT